ncbi:MAG: hypothetical protein LBR60_03375 [Fibrobacter sp.]|jgi:hypothetical protein|nr:hypothetical protein [Fibrobacter sp.]
MKIKVFLFFLSFGILNAASPFIHFDSSKDLFTGTQIFAALDSVGKGNWMEWDKQGIRDAELAAYFSSHPKAKTAWFSLESPQKGIFAVLYPQSLKKERLAFYRVEKFAPKPQKLSMHALLDETKIFRDYRQTAENELVHLDNTELRVTLFENRIRFEYRHPDTEGLFIPKNFAALESYEKKQLVEAYLAFFKNEYAVMIRAFVQSTSGLFNWQPWHWYLPEWTSPYFISSAEVEALLSAPVPPAEFRIFFARTAGGETVTLKTNGNGFYIMELFKP